MVVGSQLVWMKRNEERDICGEFLEYYVFNDCIAIDVIAHRTSDCANHIRALSTRNNCEHILFPDMRVTPSEAH